MSEFYSGSYLLSPLGDIVGQSVDKVNFIFCQLIGIAAGQYFKKYFAATPGFGNSHRYLAAMLLGCIMCFFCFGHQMMHLLVQSTISLVLIRYLKPEQSRFLVTGFAIFYLSICHLMRQYYDYGGYTLDITGPLMIQTQRLSTLAFNLYDGSVVSRSTTGDQGRLTQRQRLHYVLKQPSLLQFYSYMLHYQGILAGPLVFYSDFHSFMEGTVAVRGAKSTVSARQRLKHLEAKDRIRELAMCAIISGAIATVFGGVLDSHFLYDSGYHDSSLLNKWCYLMLAMCAIRQRYYFAWSLAEISYLSSGCGYSGVNPETAEPCYDAVCNFHPIGVEFGLSLKSCIDNWNITTVHWLRECIYERAPRKHATLAVFVTSALWHGFYPGYYVMFLSFAFYTVLGRMLRRKVRPLFIESTAVKAGYDTVTRICAVTVLNYCAAAFVLLDLYKCFMFYWSTTFIVHVIGVGVYAALLYVK